MTNYRVIGKPAARADGRAKTTGAATYAADVHLPGLLWAKALRSPYVHAKILRMDTSKAETLPGVNAVMTGTDVTGYLQGRQVRDMPLLAQGLVRFAGEKVAVVAAEDQDIAEAALDLIEVEYQVLPSLLDTSDAMRDDSTVLHPDMLSYEGYFRPPTSPSNVFFRREYGLGDVDLGFSEADQVFEEIYTTQRMHQAFLEPRACVVWVDESDRVQVWASTKAPHLLKQSMAAALEIAPERIRVNPTFIGGDFGAKAVPMDECLCYFLSLKTGRPVKMVMNYIEEFGAGNPRHDSVIRVRTGVKRDGTLTAHQQDMVFNTGAYAGLMPLGFLAGVERIAGNWRIPHARFSVSQVYTNHVPAGYMRGPGEVQGSFAIESHMDEVARQINMDPLEFRLKNTVREGDVSPLNERFTGIKALETLHAAVEASGYSDPKPPNVGRGIAMGSRPGGAGETHAAVSIRDDGTVLLQTPIFEQGSGTYTMLAQVVGEVLGISAEDVTVEPWDTDAVPFDSGVAGSRTTRMAVPAAYDAALDAQAQLLQIAAQRLGGSPENLQCEAGVVRQMLSGAETPWSDLAAASPGGTVMGRAESKQVGQPEATAFVAQVAEVSVDLETGEVKLLKFTSAHDVGTVLNPVGHLGQIAGGVIMGMGYATMEELQIEDGRVTSLTFGDVKIPNIRDIPQLVTRLVDSGQGTGPYRAKSIGESPVLPVAPAIANAIRDAVGVRMRSLPITAERVYRALRK
ncbi:MAG: xanthine dehydrogenase family protein molybdopterin-binding subunit [Chloroflexi bacterium]|nr:xanthine dehydrogenase family protein molybdopterin-binding subunit [Chloroflexota bacterium]